MNKLRFALTSLMLLLLTACASQPEVITANSTAATLSYRELPANLMMDIGIPPLDPGIPKSENEIKRLYIVPDVRRAEASFIAYHLKDTLERTGNWGAVRMVPDQEAAVDLVLNGKIVHSDGELLTLRFTAVDSSGTVWLNREYTDNASKFTYRKEKEDPFQDIYNRVANDLLIARDKRQDSDIQVLRQLTAVRYASRLAPAAYGSYVNNRNGKYSLTQLPSTEDPMMVRIQKIKDRDNLFVDTLDEYYGRFYQEMALPYHDWRQYTYEEAIKLRQIQKQARNRLWGGAAMIAAGLYMGSESGTYAGQAASVGAVVGGIGAIKSGLDRQKQAEIHAESLRELSQSLGSEITPLVLDIEGQTVELKGTVDAQYTEWRKLLKEIYAQEAGLNSSS